MEEFAAKVLDENVESDLRGLNWIKIDDREGLFALKWMQENKDGICTYLLERYGQEEKAVFENFLKQVRLYKYLRFDFVTILFVILLFITIFVCCLFFCVLLFVTIFVFLFFFVSYSCFNFLVE